MASIPHASNYNTTTSPVAKSSVSERVKKHWVKRAQEDPDYAKKESARVEQCRKTRVLQMSNSEQKEYRKKVADRIRLCRERKLIDAKNKDSSRNAQPYKSPQSLGKAVRQLTVNLPHSPLKRKAAICGLASRVGLNLENEMHRHLEGITRTGISEDVKKCVSGFYFRTDIIYTAPGMHDVMTSWKSGSKMRVRKYYLVMFLKEAYGLFKDTHPDIIISFSKFATLRPENVLLLNDQPADQCKCRIHENFSMKLKPFNIQYGNEFWHNILCNSADLGAPCWTGGCVICQNGRKLTINHDSSKKDLHWKVWEKDDNGRLKLVMKQSCSRDLEKEILENLPKFQEHVRIKRIQSHAFETDKNDSKVTVLQCDFAMAYSCEYQSEVQGALWSRQSVNLFTAALYYRNEPCKSYLIVTNSQDKGKDAVYTFMLKLSQLIPPLGNDEKLVIYTDDPSAEFNNRYIVKLVSIIANKRSGMVAWKYFATSHGKGVVDGIGGSAKSLVRKKVMSKGIDAIVVQNSFDFEVAARK